MGIDGIGSSVIIALAAVLWFLYLVPTWLRRQEYLATERNAVRLQQTMRILAESAEVPSVVRVEATARTVAAQQRALRKQQRRSTSSFARSFPEAPAASERLDGSARASRRLRRSRALASLVLLGALVAGGFGIQALMTTGSWVLIAGSSVVAVGSIALLGQAAAVSRARAELRRAALGAVPAAAPLHDHADYEAPRQTSWSPVPVPKPLYLSHSARAGLAAQQDQATELARSAQPNHAALLKAASAEAEHALRVAHAEPEVARIAPPAAESATESATNTPRPNRFARMGVVEESDSAPADLDEILRRRRAVG